MESRHDGRRLHRQWRLGRSPQAATNIGENVLEFFLSAGLGPTVRLGPKRHVLTLAVRAEPQRVGLAGLPLPDHNLA
jgi:hypothetical protein